jgi:hypothetical protein
MQATTSSAMKSKATLGGTSRIAALDFTTRVLVLFMVLDHWLNYFYSSTRDFYSYLPFLTPSLLLSFKCVLCQVWNCQQPASKRCETACSSRKRSGSGDFR